MGGRHGGAVVSTAASQQEGPEFDPPAPRLGQGLSVRSLHVLPVPAWVLSGYSGFLPQSKDMHVRLIGNSKLSVGVNVRLNGCSSLCVGPAINWRLVQGVPRLRPKTAGIGSSTPRDPNADIPKQIIH